MHLMLQEERVMEKESGLENKQVSETTVETPEVKEGMTNRGALELAIQDIQEKEKETKASKTETDPLDSETKPPEQETKATESETKPRLQPPAEWDKESKEDFVNLSTRQQEATLRLYHGRITKLADIQRASAEHESLKTLSESMNPYLKAIGVKESTPVAIQKALAMWKEFEHGDPKQAAAAYLKAKGIEVPKELLDDGDQENSASLKISPLQERLNAVETRLAQEDLNRSQAIAQQVWSGFESTKNAAGKQKYPDINESESGLALSRYIGSLVCGTTDFSKQFITLVQTRIPGCTPDRLLEEAYKIGGGRVDDSAIPTRSTDPQEHLKKSNRAASSVPGRGSPDSTSVNGVSKKFKDRREAAAHALAEIREREGV